MCAKEEKVRLDEKKTFFALDEASRLDYQESATRKGPIFSSTKCVSMYVLLNVLYN
jgi:hypothetical protein